MELVGVLERVSVVMTGVVSICGSYRFWFWYLCSRGFCFKFRGGW
jgi:hypothetical protein